MEILVYALILGTGFVIGFMARSFLLGIFGEYDGTITVRTDEREEKTVYSLELDDYPESLKFKKEVVFKVDTSDENPDRT